MDRHDGEGIECRDEPPTLTAAQQEWNDRLITSNLKASKDPPEESGPSGNAVCETSTSRSVTACPIWGNVTGKLDPSQLGL